jgi:hypothetical protein
MQFVASPWRCDVVTARCACACIGSVEESTGWRQADGVDSETSQHRFDALAVTCSSRQADRVGKRGDSKTHTPICIAVEARADARLLRLAERLDHRLIAVGLDVVLVDP